MKNKIIKICSLFGSVVGLFFLFFLLSGQQVLASIVSSDLVYYYQFKDNCDDYVSSSNNLTVLNSTSFNTEIFGGGMTLYNGGTRPESSPTGCSKPSFPYYNQIMEENSPFSATVFIKNPSTPSIASTLFSFTGASSNNQLVDFNLKPDGGIRLIFYTIGNNAYAYFDTPASTINFDGDNRNYRIVFVGVMGSSMSSTFKIYVNNSEMTGSWTGTPDNIYSPDENITFSTGILRSYTSAYEDGFNGKIGDLAVLNRILTTDEIGSIVSNSIDSIINAIPSTPACTSYTYSDWGSCVNGQQDRDITGKTPSDCDVWDPASEPVAPTGGWIRDCVPYLNIYLPYNWQGILYYTQDTYQQFKYLYSTASISDSDYLEMFKCTNTACSTGSAVTFSDGTATTTQIGITHPFDITANTYASGTSMFIIAQPTDLGTTTTQSIQYRFNLYQGGVVTQTELRSINWLTQTDYGIVEDDVIPYMECEEPSYNIADICEGIDSGTLGDIQCGFKYAFVTAGQFLFYPSCESMNLISESYNEFKHAFPFNAYFDLTNSVNKAINTSLATTTSQNFSIPFIRKLATTSEIYMLPVLSSTTISNTIGVNNYATMKLTFGFIWWLLSALIVFFIVTKL